MQWRKILRGGLLLGLIAGAIAGAARGADPVGYDVKFVPSGDKTLDGLLAQSAQLVSSRKKLPASPLALIGRARADAGIFLIVLHSLGYDAGQVDISINGLALDDAALPGVLQAASDTVHVLVTVQRGAEFHLGRVVLQGAPAGFTDNALPRPADAALAAPILDAAFALQTALQNAGYAFALVSPPTAVADAAASTLDVTYNISPGPRVVIGPVSFIGLTRTGPDFLRRHISLRPGQKFSVTGLNAARDSLLGLGVFSSVTPQAQQAGDVQAPILFRVTEQKRHVVSLSAAYATDTGITVGASWEDRNVFRHAETLTFSAAANGLGGTGTTAPGYDLKTLVAKPDFAEQGQILSLSLEGLKQSLTAYNRTALLAAATLTRPIAAFTTLGYGPALVNERVTQEGVNRSYGLLQFPLTLGFDDADDPLEPTRGVNAGIVATPSVPLLGHSHVFVSLLGNAGVYVPVEAAGRGVLALHGMVGSILGAQQFGVPPDQRFYAGGSGSVRGYTYQTIGPLFADDTPEGGRSVDAFSLEWRQRVGSKFGLVPFVDAGQAGAGSMPFAGKLHVGVGLGVRYYTGIGPIRVDVAFPVTRTPGSGAFALYAGLGEAF